MAFKMPKVTNAGKKLLAKVLAGESLEFTRFKMGDGNLSDTNPDNLNNLINTVVSVNVSKISQGENFISVRGEFTNQGIEVGFYWREYGLFAQDPDEGEVLFAYSNAGEIADYIPPSTESDIARTLVSTISLSNASSITIIFDDSMVFATKEELDKINEVLAAVIGDPPNGSIVVTLLHEKSGSIHQFTGLNGRTGLIPCQFKSTAGYTEGDTATIDGTAYTITLTGADAPETDLFVSGKSILVDVDTESKTINFKSGGGLTKAKLALADATEDTVFNGRTFYARDKTMRTGRALATPTTVDASKMFTGVTAYNQQGQMITGAPPATTAVESDVKSGKTYYDNNGVLKTGTRPNDPILLYDGYISLPYSTSEQTYTISVPSSAENWVYFSTLLKEDDREDSNYYSSGTVTKNNRHNSYFGWDGDVQLGGSYIGVVGRMYWDGNQIVIKKAAYGRTGHDLKYRFYGYN